MSPDRIISQALRYIIGGAHGVEGIALPVLQKATEYYIANTTDVDALQANIKAMKERVREVKANAKPKKRWQNEHWLAAVGHTFTRTVTKSKHERNGTYILQVEKAPNVFGFLLRLMQPAGRTRGCSHAELGTPFCPVCGATMWDSSQTAPEIIFPRTTFPADLEQRAWDERRAIQGSVYETDDGTRKEVPRISELMRESIAKSSLSPAQFFNLGPAHEWSPKND